MEMKKFLSAFLILVFTFALSACNSDRIAIEDYEWKMRTVMKNDMEAAQNEDEMVVAVGEHDELYPDAEIAEITLTAKDGTITVTDKTNSKTYSGTYKVSRETPDGTDYEVTIDGASGHATVAPTEYDNDRALPTLPINIGGYSVYFIPQGK